MLSLVAVTGRSIVFLFILAVIAWVLWVSVLLHRFLCDCGVPVGARNGHSDIW